MVEVTSVQLIKDVEQRRAEAKLSQAALAARCGISQGHYSKIVRGVVPAGERCEQALEEWLEQQGDRTPPSALSDGSPVRLAASIRRDVARLATMMQTLHREPAGPGRRVRGESG